MDPDGALEDEEMAAAEALVEEQVQRSIAPFRGMFPPPVLEEMADDVRCFLLTHPVCHDLLARIRPHMRAVSGSGPVAGMAGEDSSAESKREAG